MVPWGGSEEVGYLLVAPYGELRRRPAEEVVPGERVGETAGGLIYGVASPPSWKSRPSLAVQRVSPKPFDRRQLGHGQAGPMRAAAHRRGAPCPSDVQHRRNTRSCSLFQ